MVRITAKPTARSQSVALRLVVASLCSRSTQWVVFRLWLFVGADDIPRPRDEPGEAARLSLRGSTWSLLDAPVSAYAVVVVLQTHGTGPQPYRQWCFNPRIDFHGSRRLDLRGEHVWQAKISRSPFLVVAGSSRHNSSGEQSLTTQICSRTLSVLSSPPIPPVAGHGPGRHLRSAPFADRTFKGPVVSTRWTIARFTARPTTHHNETT